MIYTLSYVCPDGYHENDSFEGSWLELQDEIRAMRQAGYTNIYASCIDEGEYY